MSKIHNSYYFAFKAKDAHFDKGLLVEGASLDISPQAQSNDSIVLLLGYAPPYPWEQLLDFLSLRAIPGVEVVYDGEYCRTVSLPDEEQHIVSGWLSVGHLPEKEALRLTVSSSLQAVIPQLISRVCGLFDLSCDPDDVYESLSIMKEIDPSLPVHGTRLPGCFDPYEMAVRAILGQQITVKAACTLAGRFAQGYGVPLPCKLPGLDRSFPTPEKILSLEGPIEDQLGPLGITRIRSQAILGLSEIFAPGEKDFSIYMEPEAAMKKLREIPGIGVWTAQYIAMRALEWKDAFPDTDYGVKKALAPRNRKEILALAEGWRPWRGYATMNLWNSL